MLDTQTKRLYELFKLTPTLTVQYIQHKMAINSPRKLISDLRRNGVKIHDRWITHMDAYGNTTRYKEYWLEENEHANVL